VSRYKIHVLKTTNKHVSLHTQPVIVLVIEFESTPAAHQQREEVSLERKKQDWFHKRDQN